MRPAIPPLTTTVTFVVFMNDTGTTDPSAPPLAEASTSSYSISGTLTYTEAVAASTTTIQSSGNPSAFGQPVTFTATVTGNSPTGTVQFFDGANALGSVALVGGVSTLVTSALTVGPHVITATYSGDANNATSTSSALTQSVIAIAQQPALQIPTLSQSMLALLAALIAMLAAARHLRRKG